MGDASYPNEKMRAAMDILMLRNLSPQKSVSGALTEFIRALETGPLPAWAKERVAAVFALVPKNGEEREAWLRDASDDQLNDVCAALLSFYAATEREHGRQSR